MTGGPGEAGAERTGVPLGFTVPEGWSPVDPASAGLPGAVFVAVRPDPGGGSVPTIALTVRRRADGPGITDLADEAVGRAAAGAAGLQVVDRTELGDPHAPGVTQVLEVDTAGGALIRTEVHLAIPLADTPADLLAVELACTCEPGRSAEVAPAFQGFVAGFHLREPDGERGAGR